MAAQAPQRGLSGARRWRRAAWYREMQSVTDGFTTTFKFQLSARNRFCRQKVEAKADQMKGVALTVQLDECLRAEWNASEWSERVFGIGGGDGFAFVIQGAGPDALGDRGGDLGYGGIPDSVAVEFDMYDNKEQVRPPVRRACGAPAG